MLTEKEIDNAAQQLAQYRQNNDLAEMLERYGQLISHYKRLKSDYEEERESREKYKQMARGQERNPFVLVLVDGDGYIFKEDFIRAGAEGGTRAAQQINDAVKPSLLRKGLEGCQIMVRIYADLVGLSKVLSKHGQCGPEKRSLAPFIASFNRSYGLTDFVDAGELKENTDFKIRAMLRLYAENAQCKHIYVAACHDVGYISELMPYRGNRDRFTLIHSSGLLFHDQFTKLELGVEELPSVFRSTSLTTAAQPTLRPFPSAGSSKSMPNTGVVSTPLSSSQPPHTTAGKASDGRKACPFYASGKCRYGNSCKNQHVGPSKPSYALPNNPHPPSRLSAYENGSMDDIDRLIQNGALSASNHYDNSFSNGTRAKIDFSSQLPGKYQIPEGHVALNKDQQRLDAYLSPPSADSMKRLKIRSEPRRLCNNKHIGGYCAGGEDCDYDHGYLEEDLRPALEWLSRSIPCGKRERCRIANCGLGHVCQNTDCKQRGGRQHCKIPHALHWIDMTYYTSEPASSTNPTAGQPQRLSICSSVDTPGDISGDEEEEVGGIVKPGAEL
ncbi:hypothetical protein F4778DRAFT_675488 [Xylariomycetidae sp. FL2044]|nr:hypothetical protein F4778DRAFT_675488 [Xylariomycetidae sp. FL2044]